MRGCTCSSSTNPGDSLHLFTGEHVALLDGGDTPDDFADLAAVSAPVGAGKPSDTS